MKLEYLNALLLTVACCGVARLSFAQSTPPVQSASEGSSAPTSSPPIAAPNCTGLQPIELLADWEYCAVQRFGSANGHELRQYLDTNVWPHALSIAFADIGDDRVRARAQALLAPEPNELILIVVTGVRPAWTSSAKPFEVAPRLHAGGGGPTLGAQLALRCVVGADRGHYELSDKAAASAGYDIGARELIAKASRDADEYEWFNPAAHGQADTLPNTMTSEDKSVAQRKIADWLRYLSQSAKSACDTQRYADAAYLIGYMLHTTQDLATHAGITNAQHSYLARYEANPDAEDAYLNTAFVFSTLTLAAVRESLPPNCLAHVKTLAADTPTPKARDSFGQVDGTAKALVEYWLLGSDYKKALSKRVVKKEERWFVPGSNATNFFNTHVTPAIHRTPK